MAKYYVKTIKFSQTGRVYTIRDGELKDKVDSLAEVAFTGEYSDLLNKPQPELPDIPSDYKFTKDLMLVWNHTTQKLEWRPINGGGGGGGEYDPEQLQLNVSNETVENEILTSPSIEPYIGEQ